MRFVLVIVVSFFHAILIGQGVETLTLSEYMRIVKNDHPIAFQANLLSEMAESEKRIARGGFDPKVEAEWDHKSFEDKNYFSVVNSALKIPTWYGIDLKAGYDRAQGEFLDQSDFLPNRGLWNAGISIPLGKGFIIDERRAQLKRADIYRSITEQERIIMMNQLIYDAAESYLNWQLAKQYLNIAIEGQELAQIRLQGTISSFENGDKPAIDTLESYISLQNRQLDYQKAIQDANNAKIALNNFLWIDGEVPLELASNTTPEAIDINTLSSEIDSIVIFQSEWLSQHPELKMYDYKIDKLNVDLRLAKEEIKPDLRVNYNPLVAVADDALFDEFRSDNFKIGATFSYPILQRKQRGKIQLNKLKIQDTAYDRMLKNQELSVKLDTYYNNIEQTEEQYEILEGTVINYADMLRAENRKFEVGESSVFLVNSRESKYLESRYKQVQATNKILKNRFVYLLFAGQIGNIL